MFSLQDRNIHNLVIDGSFDTCQDIVKAVFADLAFKRQYSIGTVNSINWAHLLAQVVYYFAGYLQATNDNSERVSVCVPSGNFGNICAGHVARMMGLPIDKLVLATNANDVLDEFLKTGRYRVRIGSETMVTSSTSMDISKASNFERFIFDLLGRDAQRVAQLFGTELSQRGEFNLAEETSRFLNYGFLSGKSTHADSLRIISNTWEWHRTMIDPHTAAGVTVAHEHLRSGVRTIVLETALPLKFEDIICEAIGKTAERLASVVGLKQRGRRCEVIRPSADKDDDIHRSALQWLTSAKGRCHCCTHFSIKGRSFYSLTLPCFHVQQLTLLSVRSRNRTVSGIRSTNECAVDCKSLRFNPLHRGAPARESCSDIATFARILTS